MKRMLFFLSLALAAVVTVPALAADSANSLDLEHPFAPSYVEPSHHEHDSRLRFALKSLDLSAAQKDEIYNLLDSRDMIDRDQAVWKALTASQRQQLEEILESDPGPI